MRRLTKGIITAMAAMLFVACDNIDSDDRLVYVKPEAAQKAVLIEDFTGQLCSNCPTAIEVIDSLQQELGDTAVIAVGIHSGPFGFSGNSKFRGFMTDLGNIYYDYWGIQSQPMGVIDRLGTCSYQMWKTTVYNQMRQKAPLSLSLTNSYDADSRKLDISVSALGTDGNTTGKLQLWLVEDSLVDIQTLPDGSYNLTYVHSHVLRDAVNGTWGTDFSVVEGQQVESSFSYTLPTDWVAKNISVVAFVYKSDGSGVQQATKRHIVEQ